MHRSLLALAALALISCNDEDPAALFADVSYQLRCLDCTPVSADGPKRDFSVTNGQDGTELRCNVSSGLISLEISGEDFKLNILDTRPGDDPGNRCEVQIAEGGSGNEYRGGCKAVGASGTQPCEVELVRDGEGSFDGTVECHGIRHRVTAAATRHVVAPSTTDKPAQISVQGCAGL
jgi:hypothetical protein